MGRFLLDVLQQPDQTCNFVKYFKIDRWSDICNVETSLKIKSYTYSCADL